MQGQRARSVTADESRENGESAMDTLDPELSRSDAFRAFISAGEFPCVGAKTAKARGDLSILEADGPITRPVSDIDIRQSLQEFIDRLEPGGLALQTFAVVFEGPDDLSEAAFETALWNRLQSLHNLDVVTGQEWNDDTSSDPEADHFSMSVLGESFFVIGLHPNATRPARRFHYPTMVFNSHAQFEALREDGRFERLQEVIRERDEALAGSVNPMLTDYGEGSEARQYSGRHVEEDWECPFTKKSLE